MPSIVRPTSSPLPAATLRVAINFLLFLASLHRLAFGTLITGLGSDDEETLLIHKFRGYNHLIRPVANVNSTPILVEFGVAMILLINVDEKNQIMQTNVWLTMKWKDYQMKWDPRDYGMITTIRVPPDKVWIPDIVLFNNADGNYEVSFHSNVVVSSNGDMLWVPPAIYKSSCRIDVEFFPFDEQTCSMSFGSWTYDHKEVILTWYNDKARVELNDYSYSGIWDIMDVPGCLNEHKNRVQFNVVIRRKTLFYTVILIIPTVLMAFLSMMVFYLPADCSEKITLAISILLALVVFLLLVSKILPPTSDTIPLMAKYLLMTFVMNIITILVTVVIINIYFRGPTTHRMPRWVHDCFLTILPRLLYMKRPKQTTIWTEISGGDESGEGDLGGSGELMERTLVIPALKAALPPAAVRVNGAASQYHHNTTSSEHSGSTGQQFHSPPSSTVRHHPNCRLRASLEEELHIQERAALLHYSGTHLDGLSREARRAILAIQYISDHLKADDQDKKTRDDWKYVAMVIDRLLLYVFFGVTMGGTLGILLSAPNVFSYVDQEAVIARMSDNDPPPNP